MRRRNGAGALLVALLTACGATPLPDPPDLAAPDTGRMSASPNTGIVVATVSIHGDAGAAEPGSVLHIVRLDTTTVPSLAAVREDGSFDAEIEAQPGESLRLSLRSGESRSAPVDVVVPAAPGPLESRPGDPCVVLDPPLALHLGAVLPGEEISPPIVVANECGEPITVATRMRAASSALAIDAPLDAAIPVGGSTSIDVTFAPSAEGAFEEVAFVEVDPIGVSYPITLSGTSRR
jgi:hypothetical protein